MEQNLNNNNSQEKTKNPILPIPGKRNILVTSALPYVNNVPHLGNIVGSVLSADVWAQYLKLRGENCLYICGTDEYGTATETKAMQEGTTPREICDKYHKIHAEVYKWFDIKFDKFGRTSTPEQTAIAQDIFNKFYKREYTTTQTIQQLYCEKCQRFLADRYVEGTCPHCAYPDARGDQCDKCGKLLENAIDLINPVCKIDGTRPVIRSTRHLNLNLPLITPELEKFIDGSISNGNWSQNAINVTRAWLKEGLKERCITRDLKWGIPVPLEEFKEKVFYVWYDAPIGYISITATYTEEWEKWWKNPGQVELVQFMGKDNIPFHTVIFPSSLISSGDPYTLLHSISTTEYLNYEGGKFSKSRGTGVFGTDAMSSGIPSEVWRYYLLANRPELSDSSFSWDDLQSKTNGELLANLGNFVNRALSFCAAKFESIVPPSKPNDKEDKALLEEVNKHLKEYIKALDTIQIKEGLKLVMAISKLGNQYLQENKPWELITSDKDRCGTVISIALSLTRLLAILSQPYMPALTDKILKQLNLEHSLFPDEFSFNIPAGHRIGTPEVLFKKLSNEEIADFKKRFSGKQEVAKETFPADIRGGVIAEIGDHPNDQNLYVIKVDLGSEQRQVVARLKSKYKPDELRSRKVFVLCNLPPAELNGVKSEGMLLVGESKDKNKQVVQELLQPTSEIPSTQQWAGIQVQAEGAALENPVKPIQLKEFQKLDLKLNSEGKVIFKGKHLLNVLSNASHICAPGIEIKGAKIK